MNLRRMLLLELLVGVAAVIGCSSNKTNNCDNTPCCGYNPGPGKTVRVAYNRCPMPSLDGSTEAGDAADASDASDAASDAAACMETCNQICQQQNATNEQGSLFLSNCTDEVDGGQVIAVCHYSPPPCGRRPEGMRDPNVSGSAIGAYLARAAHLEAASIGAFRRLEKELDAMSAPRELILRARRAARDERRHARTMSTLAHRYGAKVPRVKRSKQHVRSLVDIAIENAVEGCVRETFGALFAVWQSQRANDPNVRRAMRSIAADEAEHALLARDVRAWIEPMLSEDERSRVRESTERAWTELEESSDPPPELTRAAGVPGSREARTLARVLRAKLTDC